MSGGEAISPTAHYTGYVWHRAGLSHPRLATAQGRLLFESLQPAMLASRTLRGPTLESYLLARHQAIDALLERAIEREQISQVVEVAAGLSPRGWRFVRRYGRRLTYVETDLADMAARKREALDDIGVLGSNHRVAEVDALRADGEGSLAALARELDPERGLTIVTEGLLGYLPSAEVGVLWRLFAGVLSGFAVGRYISDLHLAEVASPPVHGFRVLLSLFVRSRVHLHFEDAEAAEAGLRDAGFAAASVRPAADVLDGSAGAQGDRRDPGWRLAHIIEASTR